MKSQKKKSGDKRKVKSDSKCQTKYRRLSNFLSQDLQTPNSDLLVDNSQNVRMNPFLNLAAKSPTLVQIY